MLHCMLQCRMPHRSYQLVFWSGTCYHITDAACPRVSYSLLTCKASYKIIGWKLQDHWLEVTTQQKWLVLFQLFDDASKQSYMSRSGDHCPCWNLLSYLATELACMPAVQWGAMSQTELACMPAVQWSAMSQLVCQLFDGVIF